MATFIQLKHIQDYDKVSYYSVCSEGEEKSLFDQFVTQFKAIETLTELQQIIYWLKEVGNRYGAKQYLFRSEEKASALPPPARYLEGETGTLRLYCTPLNENVVILFSGGQKTTQRAQDCPNVSGHFRLANKIVQAIDQSLKDRDIYWNEYEDDILYDPTLEILLP